MSKKHLSFQLPKISLREAAASEDAAFEQIDSQSGISPFIRWTNSRALNHSGR